MFAENYFTKCRQSLREVLALSFDSFGPRRVWPHINLFSNEIKCQISSPSSLHLLPQVCWTTYSSFPWTLLLWGLYIIYSIFSGVHSLPSSAASYSSFRDQFRCHLPQKAFPHPYRSPTLGIGAPSMNFQETSSSQPIGHCALSINKSRRQTFIEYLLWIQVLGSAMWRDTR